MASHGGESLRLSIRVRVPGECAEWRVASGREWLARVPVTRPWPRRRVASGEATLSGNLKWRVPVAGQGRVASGPGEWRA